MNYETRYGPLKGITSSQHYPDGTLKECMLEEPSELKTSYGILVPQYEYASVRRKYIHSVTFYPDGALKSISLNDTTMVPTPAGILPAELITFHENGGINRLFPLNGQISGYWEEDEEYGLARELELKLPQGTIKTKIIGIYFYENGEIKGITLWPKDRLTIDTPLGRFRARTGISYYPDGTLRSFEPSSPVKILSPIGQLQAYDLYSFSFYKDTHSVVFHENGSLKSVLTTSDKVTVMDESEMVHIYEPEVKANLLDDGSFFLEALKLDFEGEKVRIGGHREYSVKDCKFYIEPFRLPAQSCGDCSSCAGCSGCSATR